MIINFPEPYNSEWKARFEALKQVLSSALQAIETDIQQVGSTAIAGMTAKPMLDIDTIISNQ